MFLNVYIMYINDGRQIFEVQNSYTHYDLDAIDSVDCTLWFCTSSYLK
jgi:hypothetical protein